ncbi:MAG: helix-turn-helix transcriptional regulator [Ruminococcaceae bacterium]|nr:helix-turn-helix transcriptional regulator [Oscillospiraceae bacterium]
MKEIILPEIVAVGIYNAQLAVKNRDVTKNRKTTMFEIELPLDSGGFSYIDKEVSEIADDIIICAKPGQIRHTKLPFKCYFIHMILREGKLYDCLMELPSYIKIDNKKVYVDIFKELCKYYDTALDNDRLLMQSKILELIYLLCQNSSKQAFRENISNKEMIEKVIKYIKENISSDLSLNTLAEYASFSPIHFHNCFKRSTGKTLREFVEEQRLQKAINLLINTSMTLSEIAYECGFSSQSYFSSVFKQKMKITPRAYAKEIQKKYER